MLPKVEAPASAEEIIHALGKLSTDTEAVVSNLPADLKLLQEERGITHFIPPKLVLVRKQGIYRTNARDHIWDLIQ
jgi:hypothetical protein